MSADESEARDIIINKLIAKYITDIDLIRNFERQLLVLIDDSQLRGLYHSARSRVKHPEHLRNKLNRKWNHAKVNGNSFDISTENLYERINDLAGLRLLHLHTTQFPAINERLLELLEEHRYTIVEGPSARVWDNEYRNLFKQMGVQTVESDSLYTSVHYVVLANRKSGFTAEIQVRTLAEELWGEVDHNINYPQESEILACREQIRVLARVTSGCTRLVDAIYRTMAGQ